jgi:hypothetical protein
MGVILHPLLPVGVVDETEAVDWPVLDSFTRIFANITIGNEAELGNAGLPVTSGTGLNPDARLRQLTTGRNADAGLTFLRHSAFTYDFSIII